MTRRPIRGPRRSQPTLQLSVERPAPGGDCVAHAPDGRVAFVRGALPGETVRAVVASSNRRFLRADTVEVLEPSAERVSPPCPLAVPGGCGGCDWQHATPAAARRIKGEVLREQLQRIGGLDPGPLVLREAPSTPDGLGWRTRVQVSVGPGGERGFLRHRSHQVQPVRSCPISHPLIEQAGAFSAEGPAAHRVAHQPRPRVAFAASPTTAEVVVDEDGTLTHRALGHDFRVSAGGFWQVHPDAAEMLATAVLEALEPAAGESALDLYAGAGLFSYTLAERGARVLAVEQSSQAAGDARHNCAGLDVDVLAADVATALPDVTGPVDLVVLDPPRTGAGEASMEQIVRLAPRAVAYVSCDGATLARDLRAATAERYRLQALWGFDVFPMTAHVECLALLVRA